MKKYDNYTFGNTIKAYDHEPSQWVDGRGELQTSDKYLVGVIEDIGKMPNSHASAYLVRVIADKTFTGSHNRIGLIAYVPMALINEYEGRITKIANRLPVEYDIIYSWAGGDTIVSNRAMNDLATNSYKRVASINALGKVHYDAIIPVYVKEQIRKWAEEHKWVNQTR